VQAIADAFAKTTVEWKLSPDIEQDLWEKVTFLTTLASMTLPLPRERGWSIMSGAGRSRSGGARFSTRTIRDSPTREVHPPRQRTVDKASRAASSDPKGNWIRVDAASTWRRGGPTGRPDNIVGWMLERARPPRVSTTRCFCSRYTHLKA
jgi:hypothetical protein